ncbi:subtilisin family serine protease [Saccharothrix tamanrassetensis]|uniref:Subtilisin family serine protease n=1 Tax=Saccharothrix tamanrassetensis TaxID=1051531 RepID=A0A841CBR2_9PSEU|nr:S8 family serine peptidase [Saccharothrix tamanrassetensis]MBB5953608.1 subtilisin family serine protease [Saccharothrix tamanrassetensis]
MTFYLPEVPTTAVADELIVDLREVGIVEDALDALGVEHARKAEVGALDLVLLQLWYSAEAGTVLVMDVDPVLFELRRRLAAQCGGWNPVLGKNRHLSHQFGAYPQTQSMAGDFDPEPAAAPDRPEVDPDAGDGVRIGVLDTVLYRHPDLDGHFETSQSAAVLEDHPTGPIPWEDGHATFVAGLIAAQAPKATMVVRQVLDSDGRATTWDTVVGMARFLEDGVDIVNFAMGTRSHDGIVPMVVQRAIERLSPHMLVVAAAGNHGAVPGIRHGITRTSPTWPAALPGVVAVGATTADGNPAPYSPDLPWVGCAAVGDRVVSTYLKGKVLLRSNDVVEFDGYATWKGTSFATATVSGAIAARTVPGEVAPAEALRRLRAEGTVVRGLG